MTIASLFIKLGVNGANAAGKALEGVKNGLTSIASSSLEAKAAVVGLMYAVERLTTAAGQQGRSLQNFATTTGLDLGKTQQWIDAARRVGVTAEQTMGTISGIQEKMAAMQLKGEAPAGLQRIAEVVGGLDVDRLYKDPFYLLDKIRQYLRTTKDPLGVQNALVKSIVPEQFLPILRSAFDPNTASRGMSDAQIRTLAKQAEAWDKLIYKLTLLRNALSAQYGLPIINALSGAFDLLTRLSKVIGQLAAEFPKLATAAKLAFAGIGIALLPLMPELVALQAVVAGIIYLMAELNKYLKGDKNNVFTSMHEGLKSLSDDFKYFFGGDKGKPGAWENVARDLLSNFVGAPPPPTPVPAVRSGNTSATTNTTNNNVSTTIHNHGVEGAQEGAAHFENAIKRTFRQMPQGRAS